jgi:hypothetical protein
MPRPISALVLALAVGTACGLPAFDAGGYRSKAVDAVEETLSEAQTAIFTAELAGRNRTFRSSAVVQLEDAEKAAAGVTDDFAAVLPPDDRSQALRQRLLPTLSEATDLISRMRFAARRDDLEELERLADALGDPARRLQRWLDSSA